MAKRLTDSLLAHSFIQLTHSTCDEESSNEDKDEGEEGGGDSETARERAAARRTKYVWWGRIRGARQGVDKVMQKKSICLIKVGASVSKNN